MKLLHIKSRAQHLALFRIAVFGIWFALILTSDISRYADLPPGLSDPKGVSAILGLPILLEYSGLLTALRLAGLLGCALCLLGVPPYRLIAPVTAVLVFYHDAAMKSLGSYVNHAQIVPLLLVILLAFFPAGDAYSISRSRGAEDRSPWLYRTPLISAAVLLAVTYAFIGARRLFLGAVDVYLDGSLTRWVVARTLEYGAHDVSVGLSLLENGFLTSLLIVGMVVTTIFEILSPVALRTQTFRWAWLAVITSFHVSTLFTMDIFFWENLILIAVLFTPLTDLIVRRVSTLGGRSQLSPDEVAVSP